MSDMNHKMGLKSFLECAKIANRRSSVKKSNLLTESKIMRSCFVKYTKAKTGFPLLGKRHVSADSGGGLLRTVRETSIAV